MTLSILLNTQKSQATLILNALRIGKCLFHAVTLLHFSHNESDMRAKAKTFKPKVATLKAKAKVKATTLKSKATTLKAKAKAKAKA